MNPASKSSETLIGQRNSITTPAHARQDVVQQLPLPGLVIFVHGVNSDGEWYDAAEQGLCAGLNKRLARQDQQLAVPVGVAAGQMKAASYTKELTPDGYINPLRSADTFISAEAHYSPVIRFRYGYKANGDELKRFGDSIFLNEQDYWGGGPFANGCSALPDLWGDGLNAQLFLFLQVQHLNPTNDREVFSAPPRPYFVLAALRLAKLIESIRKLQADVPITVVCHSQGNMVGLAAAFLGDRLKPVTDPKGRSGRCVADSYVLCNPPYSLVADNFTESYSQRLSVDEEGRFGRQTIEARRKTLKHFFDIIRERIECQQEAKVIDGRMANKACAEPYTAAADRAAHGLNGTSTCGRVTLYCNPHDQVISATTIQGIGWRGMSADDIRETAGKGVFSQRVFAQGHKVGIKGSYHYWKDRARHEGADEDEFWYPPSLTARYSLEKGLSTSPNPLWAVFTLLATFVIAPLVAIARIKVNESPPKDWSIPLDAPDLPSPFLPESVRLGQKLPQFDQEYDPPVAYLDKGAEKARDSTDPYQSAKGERQGDERSEAGLRYENHATARMWARREKLYANDQKVEAEDDPSKMTPEYREWQRERLNKFFEQGGTFYATDHSSIMTNPMHAERALAYDVAVGFCDIASSDVQLLRIEADWRLADTIGESQEVKRYASYFASGLINKKMKVNEWANGKFGEGSRPEKICNSRELEGESS